MRQIAVLMILITFSLQASLEPEEDFKGTPARMLTFSKEIPIELDDANRQVMFQEQAERFKQNVEEQFEKTISWQKLFSAFFAVSFLFFLKNLPKAKEKSLKDDIQLAKTKALLKLQEIHVTDLSKDAVYQKLSDILRRFIEERYGIHAPTKTTEEFLSDLQEDSLPILASFPKEALSRFLLESDLVKFAKHTPKKDATSNAYMLVKAFIESA